jgi:valyl-tRNA synthetase
METKYQFKEVEQNKYKHWKDRGFFQSGDQKKPPFTVVIPPPNVTGKLHLGHAWDQTLQDMIIRRKRMQGYDALYLPGMDHAGIATQAKVDQRLKENSLSRYDLGREKFLEQAWAWKEEYASIIRTQWEAIGISVDYSKERFTLDQKLNEAVNHVFLTLYEKGYIYRDYRIISWDSEAKTALSNIEVEYQESQSKLYYFNYPLVDGSGHLTIATTRPETMFADQALMVHPEDKRYEALIGKKVFIPNTQVEIPIIQDDYVDQTFGTGVVKVTPAHDPNDFEVGKRHGLKMPLCMHENGTMNEMAFEYEGMDRFECRSALVKTLEEKGFLEKIEAYQNSVGYSERTGIMVEPRLSLQWFVDMKRLAKEALHSDVEFVPSRFRKTFDNWMTEPYDWCISRQLWWGHRIPAWYQNDEVKVQVESPGDGWQQDEDVLDTWFSSALWPFSTLGWPEQTEDFKRYYPTNVLVTGYDIIFFWVARMVFQGREFTGQDPFKEVLIHGLIRDKQGRKMSKSLGNGVDPMDVIDKYGVDALRYFLTTNSAPGLDMRFDEEKVESSWNFLNKLWNVTRFIHMQALPNAKQGELSFFDKAILAHLSKTIQTVDYYFDKYEFAEASKSLYTFIWDTFSNTYVEYAKVELKKELRQETVSYVLRQVLESMMKLMHPYVPFITDYLYEILTSKDDLMMSQWPVAENVDPSLIERMTLIDEMMIKVRNLRRETNVFKPLSVSLYIEDELLLKAIKETEDYMMTSLKLTEIAYLNEESTSPLHIPLPSQSVILYFLKDDLVDDEKEKALLEAQKTKLEAEIARSKALLSNENFLSKASAEKVAIEKKKFDDYEAQLKAILEKL